MSNLASFVGSYAINSLWEVSLTGGAGWIVSRLFKKIGTEAQHKVWVATLALAVVAPLIPFCRFLALAYLPAIVEGHAGIRLIAIQGDIPGAHRITTLPSTCVFVMFVLYLAALLYFAVRLCRSMYSTVTLVRDALPLLHKLESAELWKDCQQSFSVRNALLLSSRRISGPVTLGWSQPVLLVPEEFHAECAPHDLLAALAHECAHIERRDFQKNLVYEFLSLFIAFHPVTWLLKSQIAQTREMICDGMAVGRMLEPHTYTQSLLRLATKISCMSRVSASHAIGIFDANILEKRIMTIKTRKPQVSTAVKYSLIVSCALFLFAVVAMGGAMAMGIQPETQSQMADAAKPYGHVYHIGKDVSAPILISSVEPEFPGSAREGKGKFQGISVISLVVDESGTPRDVKVVKSLTTDFDAKAVQAVQQYRFKPATRSGEPVAASLKVEVDFKKF